MNANGYAGSVEIVEAGVKQAEQAEIEIEGIAQGYVITTDGEVTSPNGKVLKASLNGKQAYVSLRYAENSNITRGYRLDKLMLWTFVGEGNDGDVPLHADNDTFNCRLDNLSWGYEHQDYVDKVVEQHRSRDRVRKRKQRKNAPKVVAKTTGIEVLRLYRNGPLQITVDQDGKAKLPKLSYTAAEFDRLVELGIRAREMNKLMKLG